jgi:tape measure domain-containing protein
VSDEANFAVRLIDRVTRTARKVTASIRSIDRAMAKIPFLGRGAERDATGRFLARTGMMKGLEELEGKIKDWSKAAVLGIGVAGVAIGAVTAGMVVNMGRFAESSKVAFRFLYGSAAAGREAFSTAIGLAGELGQDVEDVTGKFIKLRAAQFTLAESKEVFLLAADLKALTGDAQAAERAVTAITQIKAKGRLQAEELVGQLAEAGVSTVLVYDALSKRLGKTRDEVRALITAGKIDADTGIAAIKEAVKHKIGVDTLGDFAKKQAQSTLGGALDRLVNAPKLFFLKVSQESGPAMKVVRDAVEGVTKAIQGINTSTVADFVGKVVALIPIAIDLFGEFASGFSSAFSEVLAGLGGLGDMAGDQRQVWREMGRTVAQGFGVVLQVVGAVSSAIAFLETPTGKFLTFIPRMLREVMLFTLSLLGSLGRVGEAFTFLGNVAKSALGAINAAMLLVSTNVYGFWDRITALFVNAHVMLFQAGANLLQGLIDGFMSRWLQLKNAITSVAQSVVSTVTGVLQIQSPSRVMRQLGEYTAEGFTLGVQSAGPAAAPEVGGELADAATTPFAAAARQGSRSVVQHNRFAITVTVGAGAKMREIRNAVTEGVRQGLDKSGEYAGT